MRRTIPVAGVALAARLALPGASARAKTTILSLIHN
jgi:hypothetical protein